MLKSKIIGGLVIVIYMLFVLFQFTDHEDLAYYTSSLILPIITIIYLLKVENKSLLFTLFMVLFSISDLLAFIEDLDIYKDIGINYYFGNGLYILAYLCLLFEISKSLNVKYLLRNYFLHVIVLATLSSYVVCFLQDVIMPYLRVDDEYYVELIYNIVLLLLLSVSLLRYFYKDSIKSLFMFFGVLCIVFSEVMWVAYTYIAERHLLNVLSTTLYAVGFYFFYRQSKLSELSDERLGVVSHEA